MLFDDAETATLTTQLLNLSAILPMISFNHNIKVLPKIIESSELQIEKLYKKAVSMIEVNKEKIQIEKEGEELKGGQ